MTYQSKALRNRGPKIRLIFHPGIYDGLSRDKMQNLKVRYNTIPLWSISQDPLVCFYRWCSRNFLLDKHFIFWFKSHTIAEKIKMVLVNPFQSLCCFSPCFSESPKVQRVIRLVIFEGKSLKIVLIWQDEALK